MRKSFLATGALALSLALSACGGAPASNTGTAGTSGTAVTSSGESGTSGSAGTTATSPSTSGSTSGSAGTTATSPSTSGSTSGSDDIMGAIAADPQFSTLSRLLASTGLDQQLASAGPITIFAPNDTAFAALSSSTLSALSQDPTTLMQILRYHVAQGALRSTDITQQTTVSTLEGESVTLSKSGSTVRVNDTAQVVSTDISAGPSVIHVIDQVLLPPNVTLPGGNG